MKAEIIDEEVRLNHPITILVDGDYVRIERKDLGLISLKIPVASLPVVSISIGMKPRLDYYLNLSTNAETETTPE